jgi:hypothetical protein
MALSLYAVTALKNAIGNSAAGQEIVTLLDTHASGTLSARTKRMLKNIFQSRADATSFITAVEARSALAATNVARLGVAIGNRKAAALIAAELVAA